MRIIFPLALFLILFTACSKQDHSLKLIGELEEQLKSSLSIFDSCRTYALVSPRSIKGNRVKMVKSKDWTSGFFPGELWMMYEMTNDDYWKAKAIEYTESLEDQQWNGRTHDMGFKMFCSYGKAYKNTGNPEYRDILIQSAKTLSTRFDPKVGCIRSWDFNKAIWDFPVIIDNMMNLELLFWAAKETGNVMYRDVAVSHATTTLENHFRRDNSSYHVLDYNPDNGEVKQRVTHQGYHAESAWSRGQAWGLYGYTMVYRETQDSRFLAQAEKIADYIISHETMPQDFVPYWDFNAPDIPDAPRDASAAAIISSALLELSQYSDKSLHYRQIANKILQTLLSDAYSADPLQNHGFLLKHSTGSKPSNDEVDVPLIYADYYFLETILRSIKLNNN